MFLYILNVSVDSIVHPGILDKVHRQLAALGITEADVNRQNPLVRDVVSN